MIELFKGITQYVGLLITVATFAGLLVTVILVGKTKGQMDARAEAVKTWKDLSESYKEKIESLEEELSECRREIAELREELVVERRAVQVAVKEMLDAMHQYGVPRGETK